MRLIGDNSTRNRTMTIENRSTSALLFLFLTPLLFAGCPKKETIIASPVPLSTVGVSVPEGELIIFNAPDTYFTFVLEGEKFENVEGGGLPLAMEVDGSYIQMTTLSIADFVKGDPTLTPDHDLLAMHQAYEVKWLSGQAKTEQMGVYREHTTLPDGRGCLVWTLDVPNLPTHLFVTTVLRPRVLVLSAVVEGNNQKKMLDLLLGAMGTIERKKRPVDVEWIRDSVVTLHKSSGGARSGK